jgi:hypothetical protein
MRSKSTLDKPTEHLDWNTPFQETQTLKPGWFEEFEESTNPGYFEAQKKPDSLNLETTVPAEKAPAVGGKKKIKKDQNQVPV